MIPPEKEYFGGGSTKDNWVFTGGCGKQVIYKISIHHPELPALKLNIHLDLMGFLGSEEK